MKLIKMLRAPLSCVATMLVATSLYSVIFVNQARAETLALVCNWTWHDADGSAYKPELKKIVVDFDHQTIDMSDIEEHIADMPAQITSDTIEWHGKLSDPSLEADGKIDRTTGVLHEEVCQSSSGYCRVVTGDCHKGERQF